MPIALPQISSRAWEHPADRAALNALRAIPGFDEVVKRVAGFITERGVRQLFLANAVQVGPAQRPALHALLGDVCTTLDWPDRPELYVTQTPEVNAWAVGFERPFIVISSGALELLESDDERRFLLAHDLVESRDGAQRVERGAIRRVLPGAGGNLWKRRGHSRSSWAVDMPDYARSNRKVSGMGTAAAGQPPP